MILLWLPCVFLGVVAASQFPGLRTGESDDVLLRLLTANTNVWLAGILGAGIMACVMAADSQILAMSTMFTEDVFAHYGGRKRFGPQTEVWTGRAFVVGVTVVAYLIALQLKDKASIFELAIPVRVLRVRSDGPGDDRCALLETEQQMGRVSRHALGRRDDVRLLVPVQHNTGNRAQARQPFVQIFPALGDIFQRSSTNVLVHGYLPVLPMCLGSALWMIAVSLLTPPPNRATIDRYFPMML